MPSLAAIAESGDGMTVAAQVHAHLREALMQGEFSPGEKVSLRTVAERLGVSVMPVREAVARLVADEALEVLPNRAISVPLMTARRFDELTTVRLAIEGFAAETAATARSARHLARVRRYDQEFRRQCRSASPDVAAAVRANQALHFSVYAAAALPSLVSIIEGLWLRIGPVLNLDMRASSERLRLGAAELCHRNLVAALEASDGKAARQAIEADIRGAAAFIRSRGVLPKG